MSNELLITGISNFTFELPTTSNSKFDLSLVSIAYDIFTATELPTTDDSFNGRFISVLVSLV